MTSSKKRVKIYNTVFAVIIVMLLAPVIWKCVQKREVMPLDGYFDLSEEPTMDSLSWKSWRSGEFQRNIDAGIKDHIGFHDALVRINNTYDYCLFNEVNAGDVVKGVDGQLFEYDYIRAMEGVDYLGEEILDRQVRRLRRIQGEMEKRGKMLLFVFEPSKAQYYSEFIPEIYRIDTATNTNYSKLLELCGKYNLNHIDLNAHFLNMKASSEYPLFPKYGIHWSEYGMFQAVDTLSKYLREYGGFYIPEWDIASVDETYYARGTDYDLGELLNLTFHLRSEKMGYPIASVKMDSQQEKPKVLTIGDSFYFNIFNNTELKELFADHHFWYYNHYVYPEHWAEETFVKDLSLIEEIGKADVIMVTVTERFLYRNLWRFADNAYGLYATTSVTEPFNSAVNDILSSNKWFSELIAEAENTDTPLGEVLRNTSDFLVYNSDRESYIAYHGLDGFRKLITNDEEWFAKVKEKADKKGISVDEAVTADAQWVFKNNHPKLYEKWIFNEGVKSSILTDSSWLEKTKTKAKTQFLTLDEMIEKEAAYLWNKRQSEK